MLADQALITASDRLYFAYGTNLSPEKMARRCPDSIFLGKATLRGHMWQVNENGLVNIVRVPTAPAPSKREKDGSRGSSSSSSSSSRTSSARGRSRDHHRGIKNHDQAADPGPVVEGLVYAISTSDEERLDSKYMGIRKGRPDGAAREWYEKFEVQVDFEPVRGNVFARCTSASVARAVREEREQGRAAEVLRVERRARSWDEGLGEGERKRRGSGRRDGGGGSRRGASVGAPSSAAPSSALAVGHGGLRSSIMGLLGIPAGRRERASSPPPPPPARGRDRTAPRVVGTPVVALVYANTVYVRDGEIRDQYVPRMERAVADALALGVSREFVEKSIAPFIPEVWELRSGWKSSRRKSLVGGEDGLEKDQGRREVERMRRRRRDSGVDGRNEY
ncbi:hypothetical protein KVR01_010159 [Diaporthe batatas]|uniref:uncharacterized protein n=1 Tax=Diaporthe batatas TaxID=748121 RepID=UPI001D047C04|nr:uncharacterized protein KVR01_010159 [Diaporthe batatas]KAG8159522.1 hypothetical protein KVR01_010159 [Diaporthe batatas]